jgi:hypothetical protein
MLRRTATLVTCVTAMVSLTAGPAWAALRASWEMGPPTQPNSVMDDSSGTGNHGTEWSGVTPVTEDGRTAYLFNGATSYVRVPDNGSLDPLDAEITIEAAVKVNASTMDDDSWDIVRKGLSTTAGGDYKMEIKRIRGDPSVGKLNCVFRGTTNVARIATRPNLLAEPGRWYKLVCRKTATTVEAIVDEGRVFTKTVAAGRIDNDQPAMVGAKLTNDDNFDGWIDYIRINIG